MHPTPARHCVPMALAMFCACVWLAWTRPAACAPEPAAIAPAVAQSIAILDFELNDLTPLPSSAQERARTASLRPLLGEALESLGYRIVPVGAEVQAQANVAFGYPKATGSWSPALQSA